MSLEAAAHFCELRLAADAQKEIRDMAAELEAILARLYPVSYAALAAAAK
jgi:thymidylate synthase ThyX